MKVLLINKFYYLRGGAERVFFETKELLERHGHEVVCFSMQDERNQPSDQSDFFVDNIDLNKADWWAVVKRYLYYPDAERRLNALLAKERPDIAFVHNISHYLTPSILNSVQKYQIPVVHVLHDFQLLSPNYNLYYKGQIDECCKKRKYYRCFLHKCLKNSYFNSFLGMLEMYINWFFRLYREKIDLFIAPSDFLKFKFVEWGFDRPITVLNNFIDLKKYEPEYTSGDYIVYVGRLSEEKGIMTLVSAVKNVKVTLKIVGVGPLEDAIRKYIIENEMDNIELLGGMYGQEMEEIISCSRFLVVPSLCYENYPMVILEAMAIGKPVLGSRLGGIAEMIKENKTGWFFTAGSVDSLHEALNKAMAIDKNVIEEMGRSAREQIEHKNDSEKYYEELLSISHDLLSKKKIRNS